MSGQPYDLGEPVNTHYALLEQVLEHHVEPGIALEFGVGSGISTRLIAKQLPVIGFDSFEGLPEDWRPGFPKGMFACDPPILNWAYYEIGLFADTIPAYIDTVDIPNVRFTLLHIDCDLYSSTKTVLDHVMPMLREQRGGWAGVCICFDEWHGYEGCEQYEQRAWREFADATDIQWRVLGHGHQQWGIKIV